ncbi:cupin domain-containing protein [Siminovitchia sp. FSL H7-0308]|uniref:cupin domain-containing protein n=1 Tax=unclassified Siminovitchia TaxID=2837530 RepID=UPI0030D44FBE
MEIKNIAPELVFNEKKFTRKNLFQKGKSTVFLLNLLPGQSIPPHPHPQSNVFLSVIQGEGTCTIDKRSFPITTHDVIHCEDQEMLSIENTSDGPLSVYVVMAKE